MTLKILDFSRVLAGPLCSMILADLGADVIKVERLGVGDETRRWGPPFNSSGESAYFLSVNRNKKSVAVDLGDPEGQRLIRHLLAGADVALDNFLPHDLERFGLDIYEVLNQHPSLVWCTISGFGAGSERPGYDFVVQAEAGWMAITGPAEGPPMKIGVALADVIAGKDAAISILATVNEVATGASLSVDRRRINISLADSARASLVNVAQNVLVSGQDAGRWGNAHPNLVPYQLFDAADRPIALAVGSDAQWRECVGVLDLKVLLGDKALDTNRGRVLHRERVVSEISRRIRQNNASYWLERLDAVGVSCGLVKTVKEALDDTGASPTTGVPPIAHGTVRSPPPQLDEHGDSIRALGWRAFE
jgi:crotonobetainyl-CoA:carnitine CoA-transferase CaiB-like acyl-CoA transferase